MDMLLEGAFWAALLQIMLVNLLLSGDNAVVIALACRNLPVRHRQPAIVIGSAGAIVLRIVFCIAVAWLLTIPYLKIAGALLLLWIGVKLINEEEDDGDGDGVVAKANLWGAVQTIIIADAVMSLDNAIAIAAAADRAAGGEAVRTWTLIVLGLAITIPIIVYGSTVLMRIMRRYPIVIMVGGALLGFVAGEMLIGDPVLHPWVEGLAAAWFPPAAAPGANAYQAALDDRLGWIEIGCGLIGAAVTLVAAQAAQWRAARRQRAAVDLAARKKE
jgi:YjbE family integral membrane protein